MKNGPWTMSAYPQSHNYSRCDTAAAEANAIQRHLHFRYYLLESQDENKVDTAPINPEKQTATRKPSFEVAPTILAILFFLWPFCL